MPDLVQGLLDVFWRYAPMPSGFELPVTAAAAIGISLGWFWRKRRRRRPVLPRLALGCLVVAVAAVGLAVLDQARLDHWHDRSDCPLADGGYHISVEPLLIPSAMARYTHGGQDFNFETCKDLDDRIQADAPVGRALTLALLFCLTTAFWTGVVAILPNLPRVNLKALAGSADTTTS